jgi:hypothetical protein
MDKAHHHRNRKCSNLPLSHSKVHGMRCTRNRIDKRLSALSSCSECAQCGHWSVHCSVIGIIDFETRDYV